VAVVLVTGFLLSWHSLGDLDIWFHLRAGRDLLDGQGVSQTNRYSFTEPDHPWVNHEWLFQVLTAVTGPTEPPGLGNLPQVSGWNALRAGLTMLLLLGILAGDRLPQRLLGRDGATWAVWSAIPVMAGLLLMWPRLTLRPELFSYLFLVLLIRDLERFFHEPALPGSPAGFGGWAALLDPRRPGGRIFLITLFWAQFHGFAALAPGLAAASWIMSLGSNRRTGPDQTAGPSRLRSVLLVLLTVLALVITPNGIHGLVMPVRALTQFQQNQADLRITVSELAPLQASPDSLGLTINFYRAALLGGALWILATLGRISWLRILVFLLAAMGAWINQRTIGFFGVAFILLFTGAPAQPWRFAKPGNWPSLPRMTSPLAGLAVSLLVAGLLWPQITGDDFYLREGVGRRFGAGVNPARYPVAAASILEAGPDRPLFANLDAAAFLLAHTTSPVFIDGRTEAYSAGLWAEYLTIKKGDDQSLARLGARGVKFICLATGGGSFDQLAARLLESPEWNLESAEGAGLLFDRRNEDIPSSGTVTILEDAAHRALALAEEGTPTRRADHCLAAGRLFHLSGNQTALENAYRLGLSHRPDHPALNHNLGNILLSRQDYDGAYGYFVEALAKNPRLAGSALNAGVCRMRLGDPAEAARLFRKAVRISPKKFEAWVNLAVARQQASDRSGAISALERALVLRPGDRQLQQLLQEWKRGAG
jgi:tetratricopeptide (TPR) repeat protein